MKTVRGVGTCAALLVISGCVSVRDVGIGDIMVADSVVSDIATYDYNNKKAEVVFGETAHDRARRTIIAALSTGLMAVSDVTIQGTQLSYTNGEIKVSFDITSVAKAKLESIPLPFASPVVTLRDATDQRIALISVPTTQAGNDLINAIATLKTSDK